MTVPGPRRPPPIDARTFVSFRTPSTANTFFAGPDKWSLIGWFIAANERLRRQPGWFLLAFLVLNGVRFTDVHDFGLLATDPMALLPRLDKQFLHGSPFTFFIAAPIACLVSPIGAFAMVNAAGFLLLAVALRRFLGRFTTRQAHTLCLVLLSTPLLLVLTRWIGKSDTFLIGFYLLLAVDPKRPIARCALALAMVLCHREIGTIVLVVHLLFRRHDALPVLAGLALGHCLVLVYLFELLPAPPQSRAQYVGQHALQLLRAFTANPIGHLLFSLNWFWIFFIAYLRRPGDRLTVAVFVVLFGFAIMAFDFTRVVSLCTLPIIVRVAVRLASEADVVPALSLAAPFPLLFLAQFQIEGDGRVHDWSWLR